MGRSAAVLMLILLPAGAGGAAPATPPMQVRVHLEGHGTGHLTGEGADLQCSGGDWRFDWAGWVPGETASAAGLLAGDGMFYTGDGRSGWINPPSLSGSGIECMAADAEGRHTIRALKGTVAAGSHPQIDVQVSLEASNQYLSVASSDVARCRVRHLDNAVMELGADVGLYSSPMMGASQAHFTPPFTLTRQELEQGFNKTWKVSSDRLSPSYNCMGTEMSGEVQIRYKRGAGPEIAFDACLNLARGESRIVSAQGTPAGGTYAFVSGPGTLMQVAHRSPSSSEARITAGEPGRGNFTASYRLDGKDASKTVPASVVDVASIGDGSDIEMGLMDAEGRMASTPVKIPFTSEPPQAGDLLIFKTDKPNLLSVATGRADVTLQAVAPGIAELRAETLCGTPLGPRLKVRIVPCDKTTREELEKRKRSLRERSQSILRQVNDILNDNEFARVEKEIKDDIVNLAIKAGESIIGTLSLGQEKRLKIMEGVIKKGGVTPKFLSTTVWLGDRSHAISLASKVYDYYDTSMDVLEGVETAIKLNDGKIQKAEAYDGIAKGTLAALAKLIDNDALSLGKSYGEAAMAAEKMGQNLGTMLGAADRLADLDTQHANILWESERVGRFINRCQGKSEPAPAQEPKPRRHSKKPQQETAPATDSPIAQVQTDVGQADEVVDPVAHGGQVKAHMPVCQIKDTSPQGIARSLRDDLRGMRAMAARMRERAGLAAKPASWLQRVKDAMQGGPAVLKQKLPTLRQDLAQMVLDMASAGDDTAYDVEALKRCEVSMLQLGIDIRKVQWRFGP